MNKPNSRTIKKIAVATLMLSAVASPIVANAATKPLSEHYAAAAAGPKQVTAKNLAVALPVADAKAVPMAAAFRLADPLALAKQYAPDTVPAWEKTLKAYEALARDLTVTLAPAPVSAALEATTVPLEGVAIEAKPVAAPNGDFVAVRKLSDDEVGAIAITAAAPVPAGTFELKDVQPGKAVAIGALDASAIAVDSATLVPADTVTLTSGVAATAAAPDDGFFAGQLALAKAAESQDADAIRDALAKLLVAYESQIERLSDSE